MAYVEIERIEASDRTTNDLFGWSAAFSADGSVIVVGAYLAGTGGQAYVYSGPGWATETILVASDAVAGDGFGITVACSDDGSVVVVGAFAAGVGRPGQVYVYTGASWGTETILTASDAAINDAFGSSVSCSDDGSVAVVGAIFANGSLGQAYVYSGASWATETILAASDRSGGLFGISIVCSGDGSVVVVGALDEGVGGQAYVYSGASWATETILAASDEAAGAGFGQAVACSYGGATIVVSADFADGAGSNRGQVYVYTGASWGTETLLTAPTPENGARFGVSVECTADAASVFIGQLFSSSGSGKAYAYTGTGWADVEQIATGNLASAYGFSISCSDDGEYVSVGAPQEDDPTFNEGRVYVYGPGFVPQIYRRL